MSIEETLEERREMYGNFVEFAYLAQTLKDVMKKSRGWIGLTLCQREALEMIAHKIARIVNGNPNIKDSWHDIIGYAKLIDDTFILEEK